MVTELTPDTYDEAIKSSQTPVLIDFWAPWCGPCKAIAPILDEISEEISSEISIFKVDVDQHPQYLAEYGITTIPALIILKNGEYHTRVQTVGGFGKSRLLERIRIAIAE